MNMHNDRSPENSENPDVHHEASDVNVRGIFGFGIGLAVGTALVALLLFGAFSVMVQKFNTAPGPTASPLTRNRPMVPESKQHAQQTFSEPRLQVNVAEDLKKYREEQHRWLHGYGWVDQNAGIAHIPIERAKELTLERGLPVRTPGTVPPSAPPLAPPAATTGQPALTAAQTSSGAQAAQAAQQPPAAKPQAQPKPKQRRQR